MVNNLNLVYAAMADPTRRAFVERLARGPLSVSELGQPFTMTLAAVGKHVAVLEGAGVIRTAKSGRVRSCTLVSQPLRDATAWLTAQEDFWSAALAALDTHLAVEP